MDQVIQVMSTYGINVVDEIIILIVGYMAAGWEALA